jgi:hypothetical protein
VLPVQRQRGPGLGGVVIFIVAASGAGPASQHAAGVMTGLRDAAAVLLTWCGYGLAWGTARLLSREPVRRGRRVLYEAPWTPPAPPPPPHLIPDVRNDREAPVPVPPPAPPVLLKSRPAPARRSRQAAARAAADGRRQPDGDHPVTGVLAGARRARRARRVAPGGETLAVRARGRARLAGPVLVAQAAAGPGGHRGRGHGRLAWELAPAAALSAAVILAGSAAITRVIRAAVARREGHQ